MEYMDGNLRTLIQTRMSNNSGTEKPFTPSEEVLIISTIAWGMAYLHSRGLAHRDLNPLNILAQDYSQSVDVKIVDFGWSHLEAASNWGVKTHSYYKGVGSSCFRAPEMLPFDKDKSQEKLPAELPDPTAKADLNALKATDVYGFAMVCYEVLTGHCPCSKEIKISDHAGTRRYRPTYWPKDSDERLKWLIQSCWCMNPAKRPTFREICNSLQSQFKGK